MSANNLIIRSNIENNEFGMQYIYDYAYWFWDVSTSVDAS